MLENDQLQLGNVVTMHPVLGRLSHKVLLGPTGGRVTLDWVTLGSDNIVKLGELDHKGVVIILEERLGIEASGKGGPEIPLCLLLSCVLAIRRAQYDERRNTS